MATKEFYHDIDLVKVSELVNARVQNVTNAERTTLGGSLGAPNAGLHVWDTDDDAQYYWDGTQWVQGINAIVGAMIYKGAHSDLANAPANPEIGHVYVITTAGSLTWTLQTFLPNEVVQVNDQVVYRGSDTWDVLQGDADESTETTLGLVELATQAEVNAESDATRVITPATLGAYADNQQFAKSYFQDAVALVAGVPLTITHNLGLSNKDAFMARVADSTGSAISVDVDSIGVNSISLTSAIALTGLKVNVIGY